MELNWSNTFVKKKIQIKLKLKLKTVLKQKIKKVKIYFLDSKVFFFILDVFSVSI